MYRYTRLSLGLLVQLPSQFRELSRTFPPSTPFWDLIRFPAQLFRSGVFSTQAALLTPDFRLIHGRAPSLHEHYFASSLLSAPPTPCHALPDLCLRPSSWVPPTSQGLPGSSVHLWVRAVLNHPGRPNGCYLFPSPPAPGFTLSGRLTTCNFSVTRPNQVRFRYSSHFRLRGLRPSGYPSCRPFNYMSNK